ncbi:SEFIR domain-containing protein [Rhodococcus pyridinivorans]|uniref:SEFIR domain-containing protein n=1 Tax=Rhodococcus pyridinivorans TaxID=103816 RepID=UPI0019060CAB|nr:SEFIR domain-containing protein [Rhodococcus pyridinivorans]QQM52595.1 TIR domain-containing protein [Rhodococcus pyridinivorans]
MNDEASRAVTSTSTPTCFVSYSHDSEQHKKAVLDLVQALRSHAVDAKIDQFIQHSPPAYWPAWMVEQIEESDFVLVVVTETYARRFKRKEEPGLGKGASWEGAVINSQIYNSFGGTVKFIPIILDESQAAHIPFPLSETNHHLIKSLKNDELRLLVHQLKNVPLVTPAPLGTAGDITLTTGETELAKAIRLAESDTEGGIAELTKLASSSHPDDAAVAAFHLGEIFYKDQQYNRAVESYQFAMELGPRTPAYEDAKREMVNVLTFLNAHYGPSSAFAAVRAFIDLIHSGDMREAWKRMDRDLRLTLAQDWILANASHPNLAGRDHDEMANSLAELESRDPIFKDFLWSQLRKFQEAYKEIDTDDWGATEKPRRYKIEYELVILIPTNGEVTVWEPGTHRPAKAFIMRRRLQTWLLAGFDTRIARPGWPPTHEEFEIDGIGFTNDPSAVDGI